MLIRVLLAALLAGVLGGVFATGAQSLKVTPLIIEAESFEHGAGHSHGDSHSHGDAAGTEASGGHDHAAGGHEHDETAWAPADGWERSFFTLLSNIVVGVAFALILTAGILLVGGGINLTLGLAWGLAGFVIFVLAPNMGLPPELPGTAAAPLGARQAWWLATVLATAGGLWMLAFRRGAVWVVAALVLLAAPHLYGAPEPVTHEGLAPTHLAVEFAIASIATAFAFWLFLGGVLGFVLERAIRAENAERVKEAAV